jgi:steroid 5-alpha reductase family enzyme
MSQYLSLPLISLAIICTIMFIAWLWATRIGNAGVVDVFWSFNFAVIALLVWWLADGLPARKALVCGLAILWSVRLGLHLSARVLTHLDEEEGRYKQLRHEWSPNVNTRFLLFFQAQALSNVVLAIPYFLIALNRSATISVIEYTGAALWLLSVIGEGVADRNLAQFKKNPANKGKVCQVGLWNYSRHPNYFFQLMIWIGAFLFALGSYWGWISFICPLSIGFLLFKVTGIPMTEEQSIRSRGAAYIEYQRTTSVFVPWFKKR